MYIKILGTPIAKKRPRFARMGKFVKTYNDQQTEEGRWLWEAQQHIKEKIEGPISAEFVFCFPRPKGHFGTGKNKDILKPSAPVHHTNKPDIDNLEKFAMDCMNGAAYDDDKQIVKKKSSKIWAPDGHSGITIIWLEEIK